jgi:hypothetical protein
MTDSDPIKRGRGRPFKRDVAKRAAQMVLDNKFRTVSEAAFSLVGEHYGNPNLSPYVVVGKAERQRVYWQFRAKIIEEIRTILKRDHVRDGRLKNGEIWWELSKNTKYQRRTEEGKNLQVRQFRREIRQIFEGLERKKRMARLHNYKPVPVHPAAAKAKPTQRK